MSKRDSYMKISSMVFASTVKRLYSCQNILMRLIAGHFEDQEDPPVQLHLSFEALK